MSLHNPIVWHEDFFIRPQHFQQQERHWEYQLRQRLRAMNHYDSGLLQLLISRALTRDRSDRPDTGVCAICRWILLPLPG